MKGWLGVFRHDTFTPIFTPMKVTVTIGLHQNLLQLSWKCPAREKRIRRSIGMEESSTARAVAEGKKEQIQNDIDNARSKS
jgi:hypothetical protein